MVACVYTNSEILQAHVPKYSRLQSSNFLPPGLIEDTGWGFKGNGWLPEVNAPNYPLSNVAHGNFSITRKYTTLRSSQLQEMMVRNRQMLGGFFLYNSEDRFLNSPHRNPKRLKVMSGFNGFLTSDRFGEHQCLDCLLWFCRFTKWSVTWGFAPSGLTCSFSQLWVFHSGALLLPLQSFQLPLAPRRPLFLLAGRERCLTSFWELHTEMPLSATLSRRKWRFRLCFQSQNYKNIKTLIEVFFLPPTMLYHCHPFLHYTLSKNATGIIPGLAIELG